jgi:PmbA protein
MSAILDLARRTVQRAQELGADECSVGVSRSTELSIVRRAGKVEQATQSTSLGLSLSLLVDDRFSVHSTSDLRPDALDAFLGRAVDATRVLEPEPERRQPDGALCGRAVSEATLDAWDDSREALPAEARRSASAELEAAVDALPHRKQVISSTVYIGDSADESVRVQSNGFEGERRSTGFGAGVEMTLEEPGGRRPEATAWYSALHRGDLPNAGFIAAEAWKRASERLGAKPIASGRYPMLLQNHAAGRVLGVIAGPMSGSELHQQRSFLAGRLDSAIASPKLTITDVPDIPRGLGSRPWDGDALFARTMPVIEEGVLRNYYISVYYGRKLGMPHTSGGRSNWVVSPGTRSPADILRDVSRCIVVTGFLGGNSNGLTGDFSFGVQGLLVEHGEVTGHIGEMNVSGNIEEVLKALVEPANDVWGWSSTRTPSLFFDGIQFSGT